MTFRAASLAAVLLFLAHIGPARTQELACAQGSYGILVMAHGGDEQWNRQVSEMVRATETCVPTEIAFGMADKATLQEAVLALEGAGLRRIVVVRLFVSGESFLPQTGYLLGLRRDRPAFLMDSSAATPGQIVRPVDHSSAIVLTREGLADADVAGEILIERAGNLSRDPQRERVVIIAHGMGDEASNDRLVRALERAATPLRDRIGFAGVYVETLREDWQEQRRDAETRIRDLVGRGEGDTIVLPFRVAGFGPYAEVLEGLEYVADGVGLLPHPAIGEWIRRRAHEAARAAGWMGQG